MRQAELVAPLSGQLPRAEAGTITLRINKAQAQLNHAAQVLNSLYFALRD